MTKFYNSCLKAIVLLLLLQQFPAFGQNRSVSGIIKDENAQPMAGINIMIKGSDNGSVSDVNGAYTVSSVQDTDVLIFSYIGYKSREETIGSRATIDLQMEPDTELLSEVVVVGYGTVKKSDLTGSVSSVKGEALKEFPVVSVDQALQARAAGVQVTQSSSAPGGGLSVRIRGSNSINAGSEPLYVIDGFPIYPDNGAIGTSADRQPTNALASLNPNDIESIEVLKDASATSIYGSRGSNGVVLITTKRGKEGALRVNYDGSFSAQTIARNVEVMNAADFERYINIRNASQGGSPAYTDAQIAAAGEGTNWMKEITKTGLISNHQLTFSGGNKASRYAFITNYLDNKGIILNTNFKRYGFRINLDNDIFNGIAALSNSWSFNRSTSANVPTDRNGPGGIVMIGLGLDPTVTPYNDKGYNYPGYDGRFNINPIAEAKEGYDHDFTNRLFGTTAITFRIMKDLQFKTSLGADVINSERTTFYNNYTRLGRQYNRALINAHRDVTNLLNENILTYSREIAPGQQFSATVGYTWQQEDNKFSSVETRSLASDDVNTVKLQDGSSPQTPQSGRASWGLASMLARVNYGFKERYLLTLTVRRDGSSKFGANNKWATFPSAALGWRIVNEDFFQNSGLKNIFDDVKFRVSYGITGNSQLPVYQSGAVLSSYNYIFGDKFVTGYAPNRINNPDLKWESTEMLNIGLDIALLKNRLALTLDVFDNKTSDLLLDISIPSSMGFNSILLNSGSLTNKGLEIAASYKAIQTPNLKWDLSGNVSILRNEITDLGKSTPFFSNSPSWHLGILGSWVEAGNPIGIWRGYNYTGLFQSDAEGKSYSSKAGYPKYEDTNDDKQYTADDFKIIGNPNPKFTWGFNSTLKYKNFDAAVFLRGVQGNQVRNLQQSEIGDGVQRINQVKNLLTDSWTPQNPTASRPVIDGNRDFISFRRSSYFIEDGSFIRLQNLALGYTFPLSKGGRSLRVYVSGQNLLLITKYSGFDPEVNNQGQSSLIRGDDYDAYPRARTFTAGVNLGL